MITGTVCVLNFFACIVLSVLTYCGHMTWSVGWIAVFLILLAMDSLFAACRYFLEEIDGHR